jgi:hypothetical protein
MSDFFKEIIKKIPILLIFGGFIFILIAFVDFKEWNRFNLKTELTTPSWILFIVAVVLIIIGLIWAYLEISDFSFKSNNYTFKKISDDRFVITLHQGIVHTINILYGNINDFHNYDKNTIVVLPANDKFDDECVDDNKSVLGSFSNKLYPAGNKEFKEEIKKELAKRENNSFDIGSWIYLHEQKSESIVFNVGIVAVTHLKGDGSILAYSENIMLAFKGIHKMMTQKRIKKVYIPLIGSGHGGLTPELSLLCLLVSIIEGFKKEDGHTLKDINLIVYKNENGISDITPKKMKRVTKYILENSVL